MYVLLDILVLLTSRRTFWQYLGISKAKYSGDDVWPCDINRNNEVMDYNIRRATALL